MEWKNCWPEWEKKNKKQRRKKIRSNGISYTENSPEFMNEENEHLTELRVLIVNRIDVY